MHQESANAPGKVRSEPPLQKAPARPEPAHKALTCVPPSRVSEEEWAAFCEEVEHVNRDPRYIGQTNVYKIVPRHYAAVLANVLTNEPAGFLRHSQPSSPLVRIVRLIPNRVFESACHVAIETRSGLYMRIRFSLSYKYTRPDTFFFNFPEGFKGAHRRAKELIEVCLQEGLSTSVRTRTYEDLRRIPTQDLAEEVLHRLHIEPDGKTKRSARQSILDEFGVGHLRFWISDVAPTDEMRVAHQKAHERRLDIETEHHADELHIRHDLEKMHAQYEALAAHCPDLSGNEKADRVERRHETETMGEHGKLLVGRGSLAGIDAAGLQQHVSKLLGATALHVHSPQILAPPPAHEPPALEHHGERAGHAEADCAPLSVRHRLRSVRR